MAADEFEHAVGHARRVITLGHAALAGHRIECVRPVKVRVGVVPGVPLVEAVPRLAFGLQAPALFAARIEMPLADVAGSIAAALEGLAQGSLLRLQRERIIDDSGLVRPAPAEQNAAIGRADRVVRDAVAKCRAFGHHPGKVGGLGVVVRFAGHRAGAVLVAEYEKDVRLALRLGGK